jgi:hypothetical protein
MAELAYTSKKSMRISLFLCSLLLLFSGLSSGFSQPIPPYVTELSKASLDTLEENSFYLYAPRKHKNYDGFRLVMKYTGSLDSLVARLSQFHGQQPVLKQEAQMLTYHWVDFATPIWFYARQHLLLEVQRLDSCYLLAFAHGYQAGKRQGHMDTNAISADFGQLMIASYGPFIQVLTP